MAETDGPAFDSFDWSGITYPPAYLRSLFDFARAQNPKDILEVGFDQGASALAFLRATDASIFSIEINPRQDALQRAKSEPEADRRLVVLLGDSRVLLSEMIGMKTFDFIYIDGDHLYEPARADLFNADKLLRPGGCIVADDADPNHAHFGSGRAVDDLCRELGYTKTPLPGSPSAAVVLRKYA